MQIGVVINTSKQHSHDVAHQLIETLKRADIRDILVAGDDVDAMTVAKSSDIVFSIGGDGTMLTTARAVIQSNKQARVIGINTGKMGFLAENQPEELQPLIEELKNNALLLRERSFVVGSVKSVSEEETVLVHRNILEPKKHGIRSRSVELLGLNEIVVDNFGSTRMLTFDIYVNGSHLGHIRADAMLVATPTGSTGYALSADGPIIEPTSPVHILTAIAPHSLTFRPLVLSDECVIDLHISGEGNVHGLVVADGQEEAVVKLPAVVQVKRYPNKLQLLSRPHHNYYELLRRKLLWSADIRQ
jgi:NAD+ kinase